VALGAVQQQQQQQDREQEMRGGEQLARRGEGWTAGRRARWAREAWRDG